MFALIAKVLLNVAAGIGVANVFDNWVKPQIPPQYYPEKVGTGLNIYRIMWIAFAGLVGIMLLRWLGKTLNVPLLRKRV